MSSIWFPIVANCQFLISGSCYLSSSSFPFKFFMQLPKSLCGPVTFPSPFLTRFCHLIFHFSRVWTPLWRAEGPADSVLYKLPAITQTLHIFQPQLLKTSPLPMWCPAQAFLTISILCSWLCLRLIQWFSSQLWTLHFCPFRLPPFQHVLQALPLIGLMSRIPCSLLQASPYAPSNLFPSYFWLPSGLPFQLFSTAQPSCPPSLALSLLRFRHATVFLPSHKDICQLRPSLQPLSSFLSTMVVKPSRACCLFSPVSILSPPTTLLLPYRLAFSFFRTLKLSSSESLTGFHYRSEDLLDHSVASSSFVAENFLVSAFS